MSFTEMSKNILDKPYADNYYNVYQKGALIGMCLDILIREESQGQRGILSVMKELAVKYGVDKPFEDEMIIDEIVKMTYPSVSTFFKDHVIGGIPIDYNLYFAKVGLGMNDGKVETNYFQNAGKMIVRGDRETGSIMFNDEVLDNSFWKEAGAQPNDKIKEINGVTLSRENANSVFGEVFGWTPGTKINVVLERGGEAILIEKTLTPTFTTGKKLSLNPDATMKQKSLLDAWLKS